MDGSAKDRKALLSELRIERGNRAGDDAVRRDANARRKGLFLGALVLALGSGVLVTNWSFIGTPASGETREPAPLGTASLDAGGDSEGSAGRATTLPSAQAPASPSQDAVTVLEATGFVVARREAAVSARITGRLASVFVEEGDHVRPGQVIALLDDSAAQAELALADSRLISARSRLRELEISVDHAARRLGRSVELARRQLVSAERLDDDRLAKQALAAKLENARHEIEVARRQRDVRAVQVAETRIRAPFAGVVIDKSAHPGEVVSPMSAGGFTRSGIGTIVDMGSLEVEVDINEAYLKRVFPDQPAKVSLNAWPGHGYEARVIAIVPAADRNKATVRVRIGLLEQDDRVLPNMGVQVRFVGDAGSAGANSAS